MSARKQAARRAFVYGVPAVALYRVLHEQVLAPVRPAPGRGFNLVRYGHFPAGLDGFSAPTEPERTWTFTGWLDLRGGPIALRVLPERFGRATSASLLDLYAEPVGRITSPRDTPGRWLLLAGPSWEPDLSADVEAVLRCRTDLCLAVGHVTSGEGRDHARDLRPPMVVQPSAAPAGVRGTPVPLPRPVAPVDVGRRPTAAEFLTVLDWTLALMPTPPGEEELRAELELVGVGAGPDALAEALAEDHRDGQLTEGLRRGFDDVRRSVTAGRPHGRQPDAGRYLSRAARVLGCLLLDSSTPTRPAAGSPLGDRRRGAAIRHAALRSARARDRGGPRRGRG